MTTSSTTRTSPITACWRAPGWRRGRARRSRSTTRSRCRPPDGTAAPAGGFVLGVEHDEFIAGLPDAAVRRRGPRRLGLPAHRSRACRRRSELIAALRERFPRAVLLLADGYVGGQHYMDYDAERVLAQYPELDAILKYPGERFFADPEYLATLRGARRVLRDAGARGGDPLEPFYSARRHRPRPLRSLPRPLLRRRRRGRTRSASARHALVRDQHRLPASLHLLHQQSGLATDRAQALPADPAGAPEALGLPAAHRVRRAQAHRAGRDGERAARTSRRCSRVLQRARLHLRLPQRHARRPSEPRGDRAHAGPRQHAQHLGGERDARAISTAPIGKGQKLDAIQRVAAWCQELGVPLMTHYIIGFPWETPAHITAHAGDGVGAVRPLRGLAVDAVRHARFAAPRCTSSACRSA